MQLERYEFRVGAKKNTYEFFSEGNKGRIKKMVVFDNFFHSSPPIFNLAFGDWNEDTGQPDDLVISNNGDRQKVLATIVAIVGLFMEENPNSTVIATGSTPSRTRLYQMGLASVIERITLVFDLKGYFQGNWESFQKGRSYSSFLIKLK